MTISCGCRYPWRFAVFVIACIASFCLNSTVHATDKETVAISILNSEGKQAVVVAKLAKRIWQREDSPLLLIDYCSAAFTLPDQRSECVVDPASPRQVKEFAKGLWQVWTGRTHQARSMSESLSRDPDWFLWGDIGLLEWADHTGNVSLLEKILLSSSATVRARAAAGNDAYRLYQFRAALFSGNWVEIDKLISNGSPGSSASVPWIFKAYAYSLYARGRKNELGGLLRKARAALGGTSVYVEMKAYQADLASGMRAAQRVLNSEPAHKSRNLGLAVESAYIDILYGSSEESSKALDTVMKAALEGRRDTARLLDIAVSLSLFRKQDQAIVVRRLIDANRDDLEAFTAYHVYEAWEAVYAAKLSDARQHVSVALGRAPMDLEANRLKALIAKSQDDAKSAAEALGALLVRDPYNENHANVLLYFLIRGRTPEIESLYEIVASRAERYSPTLRQKLLSE